MSSDQRFPGGFKWSLQHLDWSCDEHSKTALGSFWAGALVLTRSTASGRARGAAAIFWAAIAAGTASEDAAVGVGVPQAVGTRWFRKAGGMPPSMFGLSAKPLSGRYLSFAEREEIALLRVQGYSVQEVARRLGRVASTISRELRRNAATRSGGLAYRATHTVRHAERVCLLPKAGEACAQRGVKNLCRGTVGWPRRGRAAGIRAELEGAAAVEAKRDVGS